MSKTPGKSTGSTDTKGESGGNQTSWEGIVRQKTCNYVWGWQDIFKAPVLSGEAVDVNQDVIDAWVECLPTICKGYDSKDIFNADETGLFYRTLSNR